MSVESNVAACCVLWRLPDVDESYIEIVDRADFCAANVEYHSNDGVGVCWQLFSEFLEKGVIRRARVHAAILPRENDIELALECCAAIKESPLPLTA